MRMTDTREERLEKALFRGGSLTLANPEYFREVRTFTEESLRIDLMPRDLTVEALGIGSERASAVILARENGVAAGVEEVAWMLRNAGIDVVLEKQDGDTMQDGEVLLRLEGPRNRLLSYERVGLNLLQRMSGIATMTRCFQSRANQRCPTTRIVATRKTPLGLLDKRAVHLGKGGTHRIGLGDAILIKNNHLALIAAREEEAAPIAVERAWNVRDRAAFIEVEVRGEAAARAAAQTFRRLRQESGEPYPCLLMLDNMTPQKIGIVLEALRKEQLWDDILIEASGGVTETNLEAYADTGVDAISIGALTHSPRALDLSERIS
jgi:nicotinate-nucleotide pyrophosphorylase (carboxylating)